MCDACELDFESKQKTERAKRNEINREAMIANQIPERYRDNDLSRFPAEWRDVSKWRPTKEGGGLLLAGVTGKCKTRMIAQLLCNLHRSNGIKFRYLRSTELSRLVRQQFSDFEPWVAKNEIEALRRVPILFIDDLGKQTATQSVEEELFDMIEERTSGRLPILATCNASARDLEGMMSEDRGAPLVRRLVDYCDIVKIK